MTPMKAIRAKCLECCCGQANEVKLCVCSDCALYDFRMGKNPNIRKREYTEEQRAVMAERARNMRLGKKS